MADEFNPAGQTIAAPPPPPEVKVRTMRTDLESMAKSGGGLPRFERVRISGLPSEDAGTPAIRKKGVTNTVIVVIIILVAALLGYFAYTIFFKNNTAPTAAIPASGSSPNAAPATAGNNMNSAQSSTGAVATPAFAHVSLLKKPADETLTAVLPAPGSVANASDLQTLNQRIAGVLAKAKSPSKFIEIDPVGSDGHALGIGELLSIAGASYDTAFIAAHFNPDPTIFAYRGQSGFELGAIVALKAGENWLFVKSGVAGIESSPSLPLFFLNSAGVPSTDGFKDTVLASTTVRSLAFGNGSAAFVYGWAGNTLILSTSQGGFAAALSRL